MAPTQCALMTAQHAMAEQWKVAQMNTPETAIDNADEEAVVLTQKSQEWDRLLVSIITFARSTPVKQLRKILPPWQCTNQYGTEFLSNRIRHDNPPWMTTTSTMSTGLKAHMASMRLPTSVDSIDRSGLSAKHIVSSSIQVDLLRRIPLRLAAC
jgi:hypothetical protein